MPMEEAWTSLLGCGLGMSAGCQLIVDIGFPRTTIRWQSSHRDAGGSGRDYGDEKRTLQGIGASRRRT